MGQTFNLARNGDRERQLSRVVAFITALDVTRGWVIEVKQLVRRRSNQQNAYLWGVVYPEILKHLPGWTPDDIHDWCLGECFGWEVIAGFGKRRNRPIKRSATLSTTEFMDYIADIQRRMVARGIYIPDPNEHGYDFDQRKAA